VAHTGACRPSSAAGGHKAKIQNTYQKKKGNFTSPQRRKGEFNISLSGVRQLDYWNIFFLFLGF